jgi:pilus assembly protein Flp/PilA
MGSNMDVIAQGLRQVWRDESGATATEYAVMIALVLLVVIAAVAALGTKVSGTFVDAESSF